MGKLSKPWDSSKTEFPAREKGVQVLALHSILGSPVGCFFGEKREERGEERRGGRGGEERRGRGRASAGMLQLLFSKAAPRAPGLRLSADLIRCDKAA